HSIFLFFTPTAPTALYTLSLHDALPIWTESLISLHDKLREDRWRAKHAFSKDIQQAAKLMLRPIAYDHEVAEVLRQNVLAEGVLDRKSTRLNSSHLVISYAVFCLKKKKT